jgi:hypothetical protein
MEAALRAFAALSRKRASRLSETNSGHHRFGGLSPVYARQRVELGSRPIKSRFALWPIEERPPDFRMFFQ